ncbi:unnamed protein product [Urochloa humidicola]
MCGSAAKASDFKRLECLLYRQNQGGNTWCGPKENRTYGGTPTCFISRGAFMLRELKESGAAKLLLLLWRTWHVGNEITHNSGPPTG